MDKINEAFVKCRRALYKQVYALIAERQSIESIQGRTYVIILIIDGWDDYIIGEILTELGFIYELSGNRFCIIGSRPTVAHGLLTYDEFMSKIEKHIEEKIVEHITEKWLVYENRQYRNSEIPLQLFTNPENKVVSDLMVERAANKITQNTFVDARINSAGRCALSLKRESERAMIIMKTLQLDLPKEILGHVATFLR